MKIIDKVLYSGKLPDSFFQIGAKPYADLSFRPKQDTVFTGQLFSLESERNDILLLSDHQSMRMAGIFPKVEEEAFFGFWETSDDLDLNREAFKLLEEEARTRGFKLLTGPMNFNTYHDYRLRLGVPTWGQFHREPVNPGYYPALLTDLGFNVHATFESRLVNKEAIPAVYMEKQQFLAALHKIPFQFIPVNQENWTLYENEIFELVHTIFSRNPAYKPVSKEQFNLLYNARFAASLCPHSSVLFRDKVSGRLAALSFCLPDYQELGFASGKMPVFEQDFSKLTRKTLLAKTVGVHPDFRQQGLMSYLAAYAMYSFREFYQEVLFCLMRSDNFSTHFTNGLPYESVHYALYQKAL